MTLKHDKMVRLIQNKRRENYNYVGITSHLSDGKIAKVGITSHLSDGKTAKVRQHFIGRTTERQPL